MFLTEEDILSWLCMTNKEGHCIIEDLFEKLGALLKSRTVNCRQVEVSGVCIGIFQFH